MKPTPESAEMIWERTLPEIRKTRIKRRNRKVAFAAATTCGLIATWFALLPQAPNHPVIRTVPPLPPMEETIAVMRIDENGRVRLEEVPTNQLGPVELTFGLTQFVYDDRLDP
jgi:hypothetical protein